MKNVDILNLEWPNSDRDLSSSIFLLESAKKKYGIDYVTKPIFDSYYCILKYRPKLIYVSNFSGGKVNFEVCAFASKLKIPVISNVSEGNFVESNLEEFVWGHGKDSDWFPDRLFLWSEHFFKMVIEKYPQLENRLLVTGNIGIDKHVHTEKISKRTFLIDNERSQYEKIICLAAWSFDLAKEFSETGDLNGLNEEQAYKLRVNLEDLEKLKNIYYEMVTANPDILFILKYHPATISVENHEFAKIRKLNNVLLSSELDICYTISDYICLSDLWIAYDSTTLLEAWALNTPTLIVNPTDSNFIRQEVYKGSTIVKDLSELQDCIELLYSGQSFDKSDTLALRSELVKKCVNSVDGNNYISAIDEFKKTLDNTPSFPGVSLLDTIFILMKHVKYRILSSKLMRKISNRYEYMNADSFERLKVKIVNNLDKHNV